MTTKNFGGKITGLLALTMEAQEAITTGQWVQMAGDYEVELADGTKPVLGKVSVPNVKRISNVMGTSVGNPNVPGDVTVEVPCFFVSVEEAGGEITAGDEVALTAEGFVPFASAAVNEVQRLTITATGGTYTLTYDGQTTTALAFNAAAGTIQTALEALSNVAAGELVVSGTGDTRNITAAAGFAGDALPQIVVDDALATGGDVTIETIDQGQPAATLDSLKVGIALTSAGQGDSFDLAAR